MIVRLLALVLFPLIVAPGSPDPPAEPEPIRNIVFILSDDHRFDFMSFMESAPDFLETPGFDRMAAEGVHLANAFVVTSLCSPSRASILTGLYTHRHGVVDNQAQLREGIEFFPQLLDRAGYNTAFIGKWHMGHHTDAPQPGFDRWVSFEGQGVYVDPVLNIDGVRGEVKGYITDLLTDHALAWLDEVADDEAPFMLYLSHKAVHSEFVPAERHAGRYADLDPPYPSTMADTEENYEGKPRWVREQRNSWHGVDYPYHGDLDLDQFYRQYAETLLALDESVGRVLDYLEENGLAESTLVVYMGDNGFLLGEHGLIDKRHAYEESMRVPMLAWSPGTIEPGSVIDPMILNVDVAPTFLELAGVEGPSEPMDGRSFLGLLTGQKEAPEWRDEFAYLYFWEYPFPHTPTVFSLRGDRYKYIFYHGIWDIDEFYDIGNDPLETENLIDDPSQEERIRSFRERLFDRLEALGIEAIPLRRPEWWQAAERGP